MKKHLFLIVIFSTFSCSTKQIAHGKYSSKILYDVSENILIKPDSTFIFSWNKGLAGSGETIGKWKVEKDFLILNSNSQPVNEKSFELLENSTVNSDSICIKIFDEIGPIPGANCLLTLNDEIVAKSIADNRGIVNFDKINFDKIVVTFIGMKIINFDVKNKNLNSFKFQMLKEEKWFWYFTNQKWKIKKDKLLHESKIYEKE